MANLDKLYAELTREEGSRLRLYRDTEGIPTIGIGRNLVSVGIFPDEMRALAVHDLVSLSEPVRLTKAQNEVSFTCNLETQGITQEVELMMFKRDVAHVESQLQKVAIYNQLDDVRQNVLLDMAFNLGFVGLLDFHNMFACLAKRDYNGAAQAMDDSRWFNEVGERAQRLFIMMRDGQWPNL